MTPRLVLIGPPGSGKSTIGRRLARALSVTFVDTDDMISLHQGSTTGEAFSTLGEPAFRELEASLVAEALAVNTGVVSLGGGAVLSPDTRALLAHHTVVFLRISAEEGVRRTQGNPHRPVLQAADPHAHYAQLLERRLPLYSECADIIVDSEGRNPSRVVTEVLQKLDTLCDC